MSVMTLMRWKNFGLAVLLAMLIALRSDGSWAQVLTKEEEASLLKQAEALAETGDYHAAITVARTRAQRIEETEVNETGKPGSKTATALGSLAWFGLLGAQAQVAIDAATRGSELAPHELWILANRTLALVLAGRHAEALALHRQHLVEPLAEGAKQSWQDSIEEDLRSLLQRGVGVAEITAFVEKSDGLLPRELLLPQVSLEIENEAIRRLNDFNREMTRLHESGKAAEAFQVARNAAAYAEATLGPHHKLTGQWLRGTADYQFSIDPTIDARPLYRRALAIVEHTFGPNHPDTIVYLQTIALLDVSAGDPASGRRLLERAIAVATKRGSTRAKDLAELYGQLADIDSAQRGKAAAQTTLTQALVAVVGLAGDRHEAVAGLRVRLADLLAEQGRKQEAVDLYAAAVPVLEAATPQDHALIARVLSAWTVYLPKSDDTALRKLELLEKQLSHQQQIKLPALSNLSEAHQHGIWLARNAIGGLFTQLKRYDEAEDLLQKVLNYRETENNRKPDEIASTLASLGVLYTTTERYAEAVPILERALAIRDGSKNRDNNNLDVTLHQLALSYSNVGRLLDAERMYLRTIALRERLPNRDGKDLALARGGLAYLYTNLDRLLDAGRLFQLALDAIEKAPDAEREDIALTLSSLAQWQKRMGRYDDAERSERRALALREEQFGTGAYETSKSLSGLAAIYGKAGRLKEAEIYNRQAIALLEKQGTTPGRSGLIDVEYNNLGIVLQRLGRFAEAEQFLRKALEFRKNQNGEESANYAKTLGNLAGLLDTAGREQEALAEHERALAIMEKVHGPVHSEVATALNNLATSYSHFDRYADAERAYRRAIEINEKIEGPDGIATLVNLHNLAGLEAKLGRTSLAVQLYERLIRDRERVLGPHNLSLGISLRQMANALSSAGRHDDAIAAAKRAVEIDTAVFGIEHYEVAAGLGAVGLAYARANQYERALEYYQRSIAIGLRTLPQNHPDLITSYNNLGAALTRLRRFDEAEVALRKGVAVAEAAYGAKPEQPQGPYENLAFLTLARGKWADAIRQLNAHVEAEAASSRMATTSTYEISAAALGGIRGTSTAVIQAAAMLLKQGKPLPADTETAVFAAMQRYTGGAASARLYQAGLRWGANDPQIAALIRQRQDIGMQIALLGRKIQAVLALSAADRDSTTENAMRVEFATLQRQQQGIEDQIRSGHPKYFDLVQSKPLDIREVQSLLNDNEVIVNVVGLHSNASAEERQGIDRDTGLVLAITKRAYRFVAMNLPGESLADIADALRCGLDEAAWVDAGGSKCAQLLNRPGGNGFDPLAPLPFDLSRAHGLYKTVFGGIRDLTDNRHLLIAPSWPLAQIPWHVLVRDKPPVRFASGKVLAKIGWLGIAQPITTLPAPASLKVLRRSARASKARRAWVGFGNPLLDGPDQRYATLAAQARARQQCDGLSPASSETTARLARSVAVPHGGTSVSREVIRAQSPLPETADELCEVGHALGAAGGDIYLGRAATKTNILRLSREGTLADYRLIHFATHGAKAGDIGPKSEPGLILTPSSDPQIDDDGYLTATEIGQLNLDADWVVLSACNTASDGGDGHPLSGLAQSFFYAGARSMLVSHWYVDSLATEKIMKSTLKLLVTDPRIARAEALRRSMRMLIDSGVSADAHPSKWAPFVVVGEGTAVR